MLTAKGLYKVLITKGLSRVGQYQSSYRYLLVQRDNIKIFQNGYWQLLTERKEEEIVKETFLVILPKILILDTYLDRELDLLLLLNDGEIGCVILIVDRSIPLNLMDNIRTVDRPLVRIPIDQPLARSFGFVNLSLIRSFSGRLIKLLT